MLEKLVQDITYEDLVGFCEQKNPESGWLDYKESFGQKDNKQVAKIVSAMANVHGGWIIFGVKEGTVDSKGRGLPGELLGIDASLLPCERIKQICLDGIYPPIVPEIQDIKIPGSGTRVLTVVRVHESMSAPHQTAEGRIYIRTGDVSDMREDGKHASLESIEFLLNRRSESKRITAESFQQADARILINPVVPRLTLSAIPTFCANSVTDYSTLVSAGRALKKFDLFFNSAHLHSANGSVFDIFERKTMSETDTKRSGFDLNVFGQIFYKTIIRADEKNAQASAVNGHIAAAQLFSFLQSAEHFYELIGFSGLVSLSLAFACDKECILFTPWAKPCINIPDSKFTIDFKCLTQTLFTEQTFSEMYKMFLWAAGYGVDILTQPHVKTIFDSLEASTSRMMAM